MKPETEKKYFQKASMYEMLAAYYKYTNMDLHIYYYKKHLKYLRKAIALDQMHKRKSRSNGNGNNALVRVLHAAPNAPHVDVYVNGTRILSDFPYKKATNYLPLPEGTYQIDIYPAGDKVNNVISRKVEVKNGKYYTLAAYGKDNNNLKLLAFEDNPYTNKGESKIRAVHLSPDSPAVDIAVRNGDVAFRNLNPRKASDYLHVTPMELDLDVRAAGSTETVKSLPRIRLQPDTAYTVFIIGLLDGQPPLEAIMLTP